MPEDGVDLSPKSSLLQRDEINRLARLFVNSLGVKKIKLTGGEPLVRSDCLSIVNDLAELKSIGLSTIGITTNGLVLGRSIKKLVDSGLDSVNISLDTLRPEKFELITRRKGFNLVIKSIEQCLSAGLPKIVKINCVIMRGLNDDEIISFVELTQDQQLEVRFIEYMPFDGNKWSQGKMLPAHEIMKTIKGKYGDEINPIAKDNPSDTATLFTINGFKGRFGFIGSMTQNFCSTCNRLRIAADGNLKVCLFGAEEVSLRDPLRSGWSDDQIINLIESTLSRKRERHAGAINISKSPNRPMILIANRMFSSFSLSSTSSSTINQTHNDGKEPIDQQSSDDNQLSHINQHGSAEMVDISGKHETRRVAQAMGTIYIGPKVIKLIVNNQLTKGDVLSTARIAGILAAKSTANLIPLCHLIQLTKVTIDFEIIDNEMIQIDCIVSTISRTGVEMEALTGVSIAALTIYDMCKSANKSMVIKEIKLIKKTGGKSDYQIPTTTTTTTPTINK
ncbi:molybdenum cofactor biosynthesis protein 1-like isoform X3 [Panonychus citri]|nr:molybdenum cofactor biosynthesis protein 1-like isoform X3 [Panonychus citri]XP_053202920.1 molybdenum cofactor biosynthesis protein 1-like isoform X3 [Panonychus citri]